MNTALNGMTRISDPIVLNAAIAQWGKDGVKHRTKGHLILVSALYHVASHGNVKVLNNLFKIASTNDRNAIRNYVRRFQTEMELKDSKFVPKRDDEGAEVQTDVAFLDFAKGEFHIRSGHMANRERFKVFADEHLINPSKRWPMYSDINILAEKARFDTTSLATRLKALLRNANKGDAVISPKALARLDETVSYIAAIADNETTEAAEGAQTDVDMAKLGRDFNADFDKMYDALDGTKADPVDNSEPAAMTPPANTEPAGRTRRATTRHPAAN